MEDGCLTRANELPKGGSGHGFIFLHRLRAVRARRSRWIPVRHLFSEVRFYFELRKIRNNAIFHSENLNCCVHVSINTNDPTAL